MNTTLLSILRQAKLISVVQEEHIITLVQTANHTVISALQSQNIFSSKELVNQLAKIFGLNIVELSQFDYVETCKNLGLRDLIMRHQALPITSKNDTILLAISDPSITQIESDFSFTTGKRIKLVIAEQQQIQSAIGRMYGMPIWENNRQAKEITQDELASLVDITLDEVESAEDLSKDDAPVTRFINQILLEAVRKKASDIHFEPYEEYYRVRFRCDGILVKNSTPSPHLNRRLSSRLKIMAKLDIAERRLPQDGRIKLRLNDNTSIDIRVSSIPTLFGEKIVLRLLDSSAANLDIDTLGYSNKQKKQYLNALKRPQGMILITGPTGSGKTVSLYSGIKHLNSIEKNISTVEDPVEINLVGINQVQINPKIGLTFSQALRAFLRQDPDVIMIGEIRDIDTADIAIKAAQTGHLVLSTLHTNSAAETLVRLSHMGVNSYNLCSSISLIVAQRLARRLCPNCKQLDTVSDELKKQYLLSSSDVIFKANKNGCDECTQGYSGRIGIYEVMPFTRDLSVATLAKKSAKQIEELAIEQGMDTLIISGIKRLKDGTTSLKELQRILYL